MIGLTAHGGEWKLLPKFICTTLKKIPSGFPWWSDGLMVNMEIETSLMVWWSNGLVVWWFIGLLVWWSLMVSDGLMVLWWFLMVWWCSDGLMVLLLLHLFYWTLINIGNQTSCIFTSSEHPHIYICAVEPPLPLWLFVFLLMSAIFSLRHFRTFLLMSPSATASPLDRRWSRYMPATQMAKCRTNNHSLHVNRLRTASAMDAMLITFWITGNAAIKDNLVLKLVIGLCWAI